MKGFEFAFKKIVEEAEAAGLKACEMAKPNAVVFYEAELMSNKPKPGGKSFYEPEGLCGFAWVSFAGNTAFGRWMKKNKKVSKDYPSGLCVWVSEGGQSIERKEAYARAYAGVLKAAGIECSVGSRLD